MSLELSFFDPNGIDLPQGSYLAKLEKVWPCKSRYTRFSVGMQYRVVDGIHQGQGIRHHVDFDEMPVSLHSKVAKVIQAHGITLEKGRVVDMEAMVGRQVVLTIGPKVLKAGGTRNAILEFRPAA